MDQRCGSISASDPFLVVPMVDNPSVELISFSCLMPFECPGVLVGTGTAKKCWNESKDFGKIPPMLAI